MNQSVQVTFNGSNFQGADPSWFQSNPPGIFANDIVLNNGDIIVADLNVCGALPGPYNLTISRPEPPPTPPEISNPVAFTVTQAGPVIDDTTPRSNLPGTSFDLKILGCALQNTQAIFAQTTGVSFSDIASTGSQVTATMTISASTPPGQFALSVANPVGTSNSIFFDVIGSGPQPSLSTLSLSSEPAGSSFNLTLSGTNLAGASGVTFAPSSSSIAANIIQDSNSQITAVVSIDPSAPPGNYAVFATTSGGTSNSLNFTVSPGSGTSTPTINNLVPATVAAGSSTFTLTVNGSGFVSGSTVLVNGVTRATTFINSGQLTATVRGKDVASPGNKPINVVNPPTGNGNGSTSNTVTLTVQ